VNFQDTGTVLLVTLNSLCVHKVSMILLVFGRSRHFHAGQSE